MSIDLKELPIGKAIKIKRILDNKEQRDLADEIGIHRTILSRVENGFMNLPKRHIERVQEYLNS